MALLRLLTPLLLVAAVLPERQLSDEDLLHRAEAAFREGRQAQGPAARAAFGRAAASYEELRQRGVQNVALYRNQGNAYLLAGDLPHAILAYQRGLRLKPNDAELQANLSYAREQVVYAAPGGFARPPVRHRPPWLPRVTTPLGVGLAFILYALGWAGISGWLMRRQGWMSLTAAGAFLATATLVAGFALEAREDRAESARPLVVIAQDGLPLRKGNGVSYPQHDQPLNRGVEARLRFDKGEWLQIELSGGEIGWVRRADVLVEG